MSITANNLQSFRPYHPGELVKEELECRGIKQKDFARKFSLSYSALNEVFKCKASDNYRICFTFGGSFRYQCRFACKNANGL